MSNTFFLSIEIFTRDAKSTDINAYNVYGDDDADEDDCRLGNPPLLILQQEVNGVLR